MEGINNQMEFSEPGYSVKRIKALFTPAQRMNARPAAQAYIKEGVSEADLESKKDSDIKLETAAISSIFISKVWPEVKQEIIETFSSGDFSTPKETFGNKISEQVMAELLLHLDEPMYVAVNRWLVEMEEEFREEPEDDAKKRLKQAFERYKKLLMLGKSSIVGEDDKPVKVIRRHILGGLGTSRLVVMRTLALLPSVFKNQMGRDPRKEELIGLLEGTKPLLYAIAATHISVLSNILSELRTEIGKAGSSFKIPEFDPKKFIILEKNNRFYLELSPEFLNTVEEEIKLESKKRPSDSLLLTGCPALVSSGVEGTNVVDEMYDVIAGLYKKFYVDTHYKK